MPPKPAIPVYLELGTRRVFAGALDWPGWCRSGRDEAAALEALVAYAPRYATALGRAGRGFTTPAGVSALDVVERSQGNATTDFGAPAVAPAGDSQPLSDDELGRLIRLLEACWKAFDATAEAASSALLRKGPRGGGRDLDQIVGHVLNAESAYVSGLGGRYSQPKDAERDTETPTQMAGVRRAFLEALSSRARGEPLRQGRRSATVWTPRYAARRSAWHSLDHAWEIEDRATTAPAG